MPGVSEEQVAKARELDLLSYLQAYEPGELKPDGPGRYTTVTHGSLVISNGKWRWNRGQVGGVSALDYLLKVRGMGFVAAVEHLTGERAETAKTYQAEAKLRPPPPKRPFYPPRPYSYATNAVSYLQNRGISSEVIRRCIQSGILYEFEPSALYKWVFKTFVSVYILTHTFDVVMGVFELAQSVVNRSAGLIGGSLEVGAGVALDALRAELDGMGVWELIGLWFEMNIIGLCLHEIMTLLRRDILKDLASSMDYCYGHPQAKLPDRDGYDYGFKLETETRQYFVRCTTLRNEYFYVYAYNKTAPLREQEKPSVLGQIREARDMPQLPKDTGERKHTRSMMNPEL